MPSTKKLPTIAALRRAGLDAVVGERDIYGDRHAGSIFDNFAGPMSVVLYREADVDRDNFRAIYIDDADGKDLTNLIQGPDGLSGRYAIPRILDTQGVGTATFARSSSAAGGGTILAGSRIQVASSQGSTTKLQNYQVAYDVVVQSQTLVTIPVVASTTGPGVAIQSQTPSQIQLLDTQYDPLWQVTGVTCADGTSFESADQYRGRVRALLTANRNGYYQKMLTAVNGVGAAYLVLFQSQTGLQPSVYVDGDTTALIATISSGATSTTVTTQTAHGLSSNQLATISGVVASPLTTPNINATWAVTVTGPYTFTIPQAFPGITLLGGQVQSGGNADYGLNAAYVADANFGSTSALVNACAVALEGVRGLGADLWVGGIQTVALSISLYVTLRDSPLKLDTVPITRSITQALLGYFSPTASGYLYKLNAIAGALRGADDAIQTVSAPYQWQPSTAYTVGQIVFAAGSPNYVFQCTAGGTSGTTQPVFPSAIGSSVTDGQVTWTAIQNQNFGLFVGGTIQTSDPVLSPRAWPKTLSRFTLAPAAIAVTLAPPI